MKHTKGKWTAFDNEQSDKTIQSDNGELIGCIWETVSREEMEANAKLIAAAPELLEALESAFDLMKLAKDEVNYSEDLFNEAFKEAEEAIKKALK